jgi:hypothetical protein
MMNQAETQKSTNILVEHTSSIERRDAHLEAGKELVRVLVLAHVQRLSIVVLKRVPETLRDEVLRVAVGQAAKRPLWNHNRKVKCADFQTKDL